MATATGKLTALAIKSVQVGKLFDGGGLFLGVRANNALAETATLLVLSIKAAAIFSKGEGK